MEMTATISLKKAPEVTLWGFSFVYRLDTISFLVAVIIAHASGFLQAVETHLWTSLSIKNFYPNVDYVPIIDV